MDVNVRELVDLIAVHFRFSFCKHSERIGPRRYE
jgi:hypothetical protein